eukprot:g13509.t1
MSAAQVSSKAVRAVAPAWDDLQQGLANSNAPAPAGVAIADPDSHFVKPHERFYRLPPRTRYQKRRLLPERVVRERGYEYLPGGNFSSAATSGEESYASDASWTKLPELDVHDGLFFGNRAPLLSELQRRRGAKEFAFVKHSFYDPVWRRLFTNNHGYRGLDELLRKVGVEPAGPTEPPSSASVPPAAEQRAVVPAAEEEMLSKSGLAREDELSFLSPPELSVAAVTGMQLWLPSLLRSVLAASEHSLSYWDVLSLASTVQSEEVVVVDNDTASTDRSGDVAADDRDELIRVDVRSLGGDPRAGERGGHRLLRGEESLSSSSRFSSVEGSDDEYDTFSDCSSDFDATLLPQARQLREEEGGGSGGSCSSGARKNKRMRPTEAWTFDVTRREWVPAAAE